LSIEVTWLGHATVVLDIDGVRLVVDPLLLRNNGILRRRGSRPGQPAWSGADAILLSHLHHDHAEVPSLKLLSGLPVLTAEENAAWATKKGLNGQGMGPDEWVPVGSGEVEVRLAPAVHQSRKMPHRPNAANGHLVRGPSGIVWIAGDTELFDGLEDLPKLAGGPIDLAVVPVGGWAKKQSGGHLGPKEAAVACRVTGARWAVPVHWGTLHVPVARAWPHAWMDSAGPDFVAAVGREAPECKATVLGLGESLTVPAPEL